MIRYFLSLTLTVAEDILTIRVLALYYRSKQFCVLQPLPSDSFCRCEIVCHSHDIAGGRGFVEAITTNLFFTI